MHIGVAGELALGPTKQGTGCLDLATVELGDCVGHENYVLAAGVQSLYESQSEELIKAGIDLAGFVKTYGRHPNQDEVSRAHEALRAGGSPHASSAAVLLDRAADQLSAKFNIRRVAQTPEQVRSQAVAARKHQYQVLRGQKPDHQPTPAALQETFLPASPESETGSELMTRRRGNSSQAAVTPWAA